MAGFNPEIPPEHTAAEIVEAAAGFIGVALYRGAADKQSLYDDLGALLTLIQIFRQDLRRHPEVKS